MFNLKNEIILAFKRNKIAIISATLILLISLILGYFLEHYLQFYLNPVVEDLNNKVETGVLKLTFQNIFSNIVSDKKFFS